jgi:hypothetical protein
VLSGLAFHHCDVRKRDGFGQERRAAIDISSVTL